METSRSVDRRDGEEYEAKEASGEAYATLGAAIGVGFAFIVTAVLVGITAGVPAAAFPFLIPAFACLGWALPQIARRRRALPQAAPPNKERELLSAIRDHGSITPAEAAMETSLTVKEADAMLSELASGGHLVVEAEDGTLRYALPRKRSTPLEAS